MVAWGSTDFRDDLARVSVPTLVIHGDADESVPFEGSATRTHAAIPHSELRTISNGPHRLQHHPRPRIQRDTARSSRGVTACTPGQGLALSAVRVATGS